MQYTIKTIICLFFLLLHVRCASKEQAPFELNINVQNISSGKVYLQTYDPNKHYITIDSVVYEKGEISFLKPQLLKSGMYKLVFPQNIYIEFLVPEKEQQIRMSFDAKDIFNTLNFEESTENILNLRYLRELNDVSLKGNSTEDYNKLFAKNHSETMVSKLILAREMPDIADQMKQMDKEDALKLLSVCFWNKYPFDYTPLLNTPIPSFKLAQFVSIVQQLPPQAGEEALTTLLSKAHVNKDSYRFFTERLEALFSGSAQSSKYDGLYVSLLNNCIESDHYEAWEKKNLVKKLSYVNQNRPSMLANNFVFETLQGAKKQLHEIKANYILIYFYNPDCDACKQTSSDLLQSEIINKNINSNNLSLLAICMNNQLEKWKSSLNGKENWIHGCDSEDKIFTSGLYNLISIPSLYLVDKDKKVILKDCTVNDVMVFFNAK